MPCRRARWWSTLAKPRSSKGRWRRRSTASSGDSFFFRTCSNSLRNASEFTRTSGRIFAPYNLDHKSPQKQLDHRVLRFLPKHQTNQKQVLSVTYLHYSSGSTPFGEIVVG